MQTGIGYDEAGCLEQATRECEADVALVEAGEASFHAENVSRCLDAFGDFVQQCKGSISTYIALVRDVGGCGPVFDGNKQEGDTCASDSECASSTDPDVFVSCDEMTSRCTRFEVLSAGEACSFGGGDFDSFCDNGLYCDVDITSGLMPPWQGTCKSATLEGDACDTSLPFNFECGLGYYCDLDTGKCVRGRPGGGLCDDAAGGGLMCESLQCEAGVCQPISPLLDDQACKGSG